MDGPELRDLASTGDGRTRTTRTIQIATHINNAQPENKSRIQGGKSVAEALLKFAVFRYQHDVERVAAEREEQRPE
jgi:hypothetical protein